MTIKLNENPRYGGDDHWSYIDGVTKLRVLLVGECNVTKTDDLIRLVPLKKDSPDIEPFKDGYDYVPSINYDQETVIIHKFFGRDQSGNGFYGLFHDKGMFLLNEHGDTIDRY